MFVGNVCKFYLNLKLFLFENILNKLQLFFSSTEKKVLNKEVL